MFPENRTMLPRPKVVADDLNGRNQDEFHMPSESVM